MTEVETSGAAVPALVSMEGLDKMKSWAAHPAMAANLVQDETIMGGLVLALSHSNQPVVDNVLQILLLLSEKREHRQKLKDSLGMIDQLLAVIARGSPSQAETAHVIEQRLQHVSSHHHERGDKNRHDEKGAEKKKRRNSFFIGSVAKSRMVVLQVRGLNDRYDAEAARNSLIRVKGVISITFDLKAKRVILRTKPELQPELLGAAIARTMTMCADQVIKDDKGEEQLVPFSQAVESAGDMIAEEDLPDYPDDTSPVRGDTNMARLGDSTPGKDGSFGFIKSVGSFLSSSFYW